MAEAQTAVAASGAEAPQTATPVAPSVDPAVAQLGASLAKVDGHQAEKSSAAPVEGKTGTDQPTGGDAAGTDPLNCTPFQIAALEKIGLTPEDVVALHGDKAKEKIKAIANERRQFDRRADENRRLKEEAKAKAKAAEKAEPDPLDNLADDDPMTKAEVDAYIERKLAEKMAAQPGTTPEQDANAADEFVKALDPDIYPMFGMGAMGDLDADSAEAEARNELFAKAQEFQADAKTRGGALTLPRALDRAKRVLYPDEHDMEIEKRTLDTTAARRKGSGLPPTSKAGPIRAQSADDKAAAELREHLKRVG